MSGFAISCWSSDRKIDKLCMALSRVFLSFLDISLSTIFTWRIYSYTPVDARYFPKGGAVVEVIACDRNYPKKENDGIPVTLKIASLGLDQYTHLGCNV